MNRVILLLLGLVVLNNSVLACVPAVAIKYIVKHRLEHFNDDIDITEPVRITKEDLEDYFNANKNPSFRIGLDRMILQQLRIQHLKKQQLKNQKARQKIRKLMSQK